MLNGLRRISFGCARRLCVALNRDKVLLIQDLNFEESAVYYVCRHRGVVGVVAVNPGVMDVGEWMLVFCSIV